VGREEGGEKKKIHVREKKTLKGVGPTLGPGWKRGALSNITKCYKKGSDKTGLQRRGKEKLEGLGQKKKDKKNRLSGGGP